MRRVDGVDTSRMCKAQLVAADGPVASRADRAREFAVRGAAPRGDVWEEPPAEC